MPYVSIKNGQLHYSNEPYTGENEIQFYCDDWVATFAKYQLRKDKDLTTADLQTFSHHALNAMFISDKIKTEFPDYKEILSGKKHTVKIHQEVYTYINYICNYRKNCAVFDLYRGYNIRLIEWTVSEAPNHTILHGGIPTSPKLSNGTYNFGMIGAMCGLTKYNNNTLVFNGEEIFGIYVKSWLEKNFPYFIIVMRDGFYDVSPTQGYDLKIDRALPIEQRIAALRVAIAEAKTELKVHTMCESAKTRDYLTLCEA